MVNLFSIINDKEKKVTVLMDKTLYEAEWASFHPMDNTASTAINKAGIDKLKELTGRDDQSFQIVDFSTITSGDGAQKPAKDKPKPQQNRKLTAEEKK